MLVKELISSCSNPNVAQAALASIGGSFAARVEAYACDIGVEPGVATAQAVRYFAQNAGNGDWEVLRRATTGNDQPLLAGLQHILETTLQAGGMFNKTRAKVAGKAATSFSVRPHPSAGCYTAC